MDPVTSEEIQAKKQANSVIYKKKIRPMKKKMRPKSM
jgi:hypothetical protein